MRSCVSTSRIGKRSIYQSYKMYQQLSLTLIMIALVACLFGTRLKPAWVFAAAIGISYLAGLIELEAMLVNFANPSLITLVLLILVSIGIEKTAFV